MAPLTDGRIVRAADLTPVLWRNGHGVSRQIADASAPDGTLLWQVGIADLVANAPFSDYTGIDRIFTVLDGNIELAIDAAPYRSCAPLTPVPFRGESHVLCRVMAPGHAFNVFTARHAHRAQVDIRHLPSGAPCPANHVLHCVSGRLVQDSRHLAPGDSLIDGTGQWTATEATIAILVSIELLG